MKKLKKIQVFKVVEQPSLVDRLSAISKKGRVESMAVNAEFGEVEHDPDTVVPPSLKPSTEINESYQDAVHDVVILEAIWNILGVTPPPSAQATTTLFDAREYLHKAGLPFKSVTRISQVFHVNITNEMPGILGIPARTLLRRKTQGNLDFNESVTVFIAAEFFQEAVSIFGSPEAAVAWFKEPNFAIREKRPLDLISDDLGRKLVGNVLGQIKHGRYS